MFLSEGEKRLGVLRPAAAGMLAGAASAAILLSAAAELMSRGKIGMDAALPIVTGINFAAAAAAGLAASARGRGTAKSGLLAGVIFSVILLIAGLILNRGGISESEIIRILICSVLGGLFGGVLKAGKSNKKLHKYHVKK